MGIPSTEYLPRRGPEYPGQGQSGEAAHGLNRAASSGIITPRPMPELVPSCASQPPPQTQWAKNG